MLLSLSDRQRTRRQWTPGAHFNRPGTDGGGFGCSGDDIKVILDDDAGSAIQDDCQSASAYPEERYRPANALSAYAGLALTGDRILTVSDNADGDTGQQLSLMLPAQPDCAGSARHGRRCA